MLAKIRKAIKGDHLTSQLSGHIEVDEAYFGGRRKGSVAEAPPGKHRSSASFREMEMSERLPYPT